MNKSGTYEKYQETIAPGLFQSRVVETQRVETYTNSYLQPTQQKQTTTQLTSSGANWASTQLLGRVDQKDFMVVQKSKQFEKSEEERQHHYEELIQDNLRMREVIEQLKRDVQTYKSNSSVDVNVIKKELVITQQELEVAQAELLKLRSGLEQSTNTQIIQFQKEIDDWKKKYAEAEQRINNNQEALKQLNYYQSKLKVVELEQRKKYEKYQTVDQLQQKLDDQEQLIEELKIEIKRWQDKCDAITLESQEIRIKLSSNNKVSQLESEIEALLHEIEQWKQRCRALELRFENSEESKLLLRIEQLNKMLGEKDLEMQKTRLTLTQQIDTFHSQSKLQASQYQQQQHQEFSSEIDRLKNELSLAQKKLSDYDREMEGYRLTTTVYSSEKFEELEQDKWKLEAQIDLLEKDCDTFMLRIKELEQQIQEIQIQYNEQNAQYIKYKTTVDANSSKYQTQENLKKELQTVQQELDVWKNRYFQTEIRLKQYDHLQIEYNELLSKSKVQTSNVIVNIETNSQYISLKKERDTYQRQVQELETRIQELSLQNKTEISTTKVITDNSKVRELEATIRDLQFQLLNQNNNNSNIQFENTIQDLRLKINQLESIISDYQIKIQTYETKINNYELKISNENKNRSSFVEKTVVLTDEPKIKELTVIIQQKNQKILELESQLSQSGQNTTIVIREQVRIKELRIRELETSIETLQLEIERLQNLKKDQEARIAVMIKKITEYESQLNILQEQQLRQSRKSPPHQQITSTTTYKTQQPVIQTTSYVVNTSSKNIEQNTSSSNNNPQIISSYKAIQQQTSYQVPQQQTIIQNQNSLIKEQGYTSSYIQGGQVQTSIVQTRVSNTQQRNLYPQEENANSLIVDRINPNGNLTQQPQIIVSQYKAGN